MDHSRHVGKLADQFPVDGDRQRSPDSLVAIGCSQIVLLWIVVALVGYAVSAALSMGGSGQRDGSATILALLIIVMFIGAPLYASYRSGHARPFWRGIAGALVWFAVASVCSLILAPLREEFLAAVPLIATGAMLPIVLPASRTTGNVIRLSAPVISGAAVVIVLSLLEALTVVPFEWWIMAMSLGYIVALGAVYVLDLMGSP
jgi:hypothetical protein